MRDVRAAAAANSSSGVGQEPSDWKWLSGSHSESKPIASARCA